MNCKYCGCYIPKYFKECPACVSNSQKEIVAVMPAPVRTEIVEPQVVINFENLFSHDKVYLHWSNLKSEMWKAKALFKWWIKENYIATDRFTSSSFKMDAPYALVGDLLTCDVGNVLDELARENFLCYIYSFGNDYFFIRPQTKKEFKKVAKELKLSKNYRKKFLKLINIKNNNMKNLNIIAKELDKLEIPYTYARGKEVIWCPCSPFLAERKGFEGKSLFIDLKDKNKNNGLSVGVYEISPFNFNIPDIIERNLTPHEALSKLLNFYYEEVDK